MRERNSGKNKPSIGTFDEKKYLKVTAEGRIRGAIILEKGISINGSNHYFSLKNHNCGSAAYLVAVLGNQLYCLECGGQIVLARENENYTIPIEVACSKCGLVYEPLP